MALAQSVKVGTFEFELSNTDLIIIPSGDFKPVKIVVEGTAIVNDFENSQGDMSIEHLFIQKMGVGVPIANNFAIARFS